MKKTSTLFTITVAVLTLFLCSGNTVNGQANKDQALWKTGEGNYKGYRIPAIIVSSKGKFNLVARSSHDSSDTLDSRISLSSR